MKTYIHLKSEREDCFQTLSLQFKFAKRDGVSNGANPAFVLFNSRWWKIRSCYVPGTPYANLVHYIGPKKTMEQYKISFEYGG